MIYLTKTLRESEEKHCGIIKQVAFEKDDNIIHKGVGWTEKRGARNSGGTRTAINEPNKK